MTYIRKAEQGDAEALLALLREIGWFSAINGAPAVAALERVARHLDMALADSSHSIYVAQSEGGALLGYVAAHWLPYLILAGPEGYVSELFVREAARGQGIGGRLLALVKQEAQARGCARLSLLNMRGRESYRRGFYQRDGWQERPEAANFIFLLNQG